MQSFKYLPCSLDFPLFELGLAIIVLKGKLERPDIPTNFEPRIYHTGVEWTEILDKGIYTVLTLSFNHFSPGMLSKGEARGRGDSFRRIVAEK